MALFLPQRWKQQPQSIVQVDWSNGYFDRTKTSAILCGSQGLTRNLVNESWLTGSGYATAIGSGGQAITFGSGGTGYLELAADADNVLDTTATTMIIVRSLNSLSYPNCIAYGYENGASDRMEVSLPYADGTVYWDFGNATAGSGRTSATGLPFAVGQTDVLILVAGSRGREIWRNGSLVGSDSGATATRSGTTKAFRIGAADSPAPGKTNNENLYLFGLVREQWPAAKIVEFSRAPYGATFKPLVPRIYFNVSAGGATGTISGAETADSASIAGNATGTVGATETADTATITGAASGTIGATESADTASIVGSSDGIFANESADTAAITGNATGAIAATETADTVSIVGYVIGTGTIVCDEASDTLVIAGLGATLWSPVSAASTTWTPRTGASTTWTLQ